MRGRAAADVGVVVSWRLRHVNVAKDTKQSIYNLLQFCSPTIHYPALACRGLPIAATHIYSLRHRHSWIMQLYRSINKHFILRGRRLHYKRESGRQLKPHNVNAKRQLLQLNYANAQNFDKGSTHSPKNQPTHSVIHSNLKMWINRQQKIFLAFNPLPKKPLKL